MATWSLNPLVWFERAREGSEICSLVVLLHLAAAVATLIAMQFDHRQLLGVSIWLKPFKFYVSAAIYLLSVAWLLNYVEVPEVKKSIVGLGVSLIMLAENFGITFQAIRGERSHFNISTPLNGIIFGLMGILILVNTLLLCWLLWWMMTSNIGMPAGALWGCRLGILLTILASIEGGYMAQYGSHTVGSPDGGPGWGWLNWSTTAGDLRISHFIGLHGLQVLPVAGFLLSEIGLSAGILILAALHYGAFFITFLQAVAKKPLIF